MVRVQQELPYYVSHNKSNKKDFSLVARIFCSKSHVAHYSVEFHRVWGLPNTGVDNLRSFLECFVVSRM